MEDKLGGELSYQISVQKMILLIVRLRTNSLPNYIQTNNRIHVGNIVQDAEIMGQRTGR